MEERRTMEGGKWRSAIRDWRREPIRRSPISSFFGDRRGATMVTYSLVLPLFLLIIFGAATIWRVISLKQSTDVATYEAARYLSHEGRRIAARALPYYNPDGWAQIAYAEVEPEIQDLIRRNPFVHDGDVIQVEIVPPVDVDCNPWGAAVTNDSRAPENIGFTVTTRLSVESPIQIPFIERPLTLTLQESHSEMVECPRYQGDPPDEGPIFFSSERRP